MRLSPAVLFHGSLCFTLGVALLFGIAFIVLV
jgi:hypothetical protein